MEKLIGRVTHFFNKISVAIIEITDEELKVGDRIHIKGHTSDFEQVITSMQIEHASISMAKKGDQIGIKVDAHAHEHDQVFKVLPD